MGRGATVLTTASLVFVASGYVVALVLARILGPQEYGRVSVAIAVMTIFNTVHSSGLPQAVARNVAAKPAAAGAVLATALPLQIGATVATAVAILAAAAVAATLADPIAPYLAAAAAAIVPHGLLNLYMGHANGLHDFRGQAILLVLYAVAKVAIVLPLALVGRGIGAVAGYAAASVAVLIVGRRASSASDRVPGLDLVRFAIPIVAQVGLATVHLNVDLLLVEVLTVAPAEPGWYAAAQQVARAPYLALTGLAMTLLPVVAGRAARDAAAELGPTVRQALRYTLLLLAPAVAILLVASPAIVELVFGKDYRPAASVLPLLMIGTAFLTIGAVISAVLTGLGRPEIPVVASVGGLVVTIVVGVALIPTAGAAGAATGLVLGGGVVAGSLVAAVSRLLGTVTDWSSMLRIAAAASAAAVLVAVLDPHGLLLIAVLPGALAAYGAVLAALREVDRADVERLLQATRSRGAEGGPA